MKRHISSFWPTSPRPPQARGRALLVALVLLVAGLLPLHSRAQLVANYTLVPSAGTFTELTGATLVPTLRVDTGNTPAIALGFTFRFEGVDYTSVIATSDGYLTFNPNLTSSTYGNGFAYVTPASDPLIAGLWDDLTGTVPNSQASYAVTGAPGSRVFTFEWLNWGWNYNATAGSVSFQIKLREGSNQVELVYRPEAGAVVSGSASVGLRSAGGQGPGSFLSVTNLGTSATASSITATDNISAKPTASGLTFTFTPPACPGPPPTYATLPVSQSFEAAWADACAIRNAAGASWRTTPLIGDNSWRRDDDGAAALWRSPTGYLPTPVASQGSHAAIFHSAYANAGSIGNLDLYVDLSPGGTKTLSFDYVNAATVSGSNPEKLEVLLSSDGGATFGAPLLTLTVATAYTPQSVTVPGTSATCVIRFRGTGEYGNTDIGIDNVRLAAAACAPPTAPAISAITSTSASLSFTASATASSYSVSYQPAGGATQTVSAAASPVALTGLTPATIYTVTALSNCGAGATSPATPTVTFTTAPANDLCANAQALTPATPCAGTAGTVGGATGAGPAGSSGTADDDVWYSFVATSTQHRITVTENVYTNATDLSHEVFGGGSCPGASTTPLFSSFQPTILATGLTVGQTYYVRVYSYYAVPLSPTAGAFTICVDQPSNVPTNDECAGAVALTNPGNTCVSTSGTVFGATQSTVSGGTAAGTADDDVWYSFVATNAAAAVALTNTGGLDLVVNLRTGPCASGTSLRYGDQGNSTPGTIDSVIVRNLTVGQTYYVRAYSYYAVPATAANGTFTLCVTVPPPLPTSCASPTALAAASITTTGADLSWTPGASAATYALEYGLSGFTPGSAGGTVISGLAAPTRFLTGLTPATTYQFYVTQTCASGQSSVRVGPVSFTTLGAPPTCAAPTALTSGSITSSSATLSWTPGASAATYAVEYGLNGFTPGSAGGTVVSGLVAPTQNLTGLTPATTYQFYVTQTCASGQSSVRVGPANFTTLGAAANNLIVSTTQTVQGTYDNVTITPTGVATLSGTLTVNQSLTVQDGGRLNTDCQLITGPGSFTLGAGGTLGICDPAGISLSGPTGAVQVSGTRSFNSDASYVYNATGSSPATGSGLPGQVRELTVNIFGLSFVNLTNPSLDVTRVLRFTSGSLLVGANARVRLLSGPGGTALVDNTGGGITGTGASLSQVQRYVNASLNAGRGYRHFSAPVGGAPLSQLGSGGSPVVTNVAFNAASATVRPTIVPFPTVFYYDQSQVPATGTLAAFDQGWTSPAAASSIMGTGQGFTMQASGAETITFQGTLTTGPVQLPGLGFGPNATQAGWQLLGNPYPSPLDWSTLSVGTAATDNLQNLNGAVYVFQSSGPYAGTYRSYIGGIGNPLVASGQGFFVRTAGVGQTGTLRLANANRVTTWSATNSTLLRSTADTRPQVHLRLSSPTAGLAPDVAVVYFQAGATAGLDAAADAYKLRNPGAAVSLFSLAGPEELSINGLPLSGGLPLSVPLGLSVPQAGSYTFEADQLLNFRPGDVQLRDNLTGTLVDLSQQPTYAFQVAAGSLSTTTRFALLFRPGRATATMPALSAAQVGLFPNPARQEFTLTMPGLPTARTVVAELLNALGQQVLVQTLALPGGGLRARFDVHALPTGVYSLRLTASNEPPLTKRLIIE